MKDPTPPGRSEEEILLDYRRRGLASRLGYGASPAILVVDFIVGFTNPVSPLGANLDSEIASTQELLQAAERANVPAFFTTTGYGPSCLDAGYFVRKVPSLEFLEQGSKWVELDPRLGDQQKDRLVEKKYASAFFGTHLASTMHALGIDTVLLAGCTTSGCIRASAIDALQHGFRPIVPRQCVGDRAPEAHRANLLDIDSKYGDVVELEEALTYLATLSHG